MGKLTQRDRHVTPLPLRRVSILTRRCSAWAIEVSLLLLAGWIPYGIGSQARIAQAQHQVPMNPMLVATRQVFATTAERPDSIVRRTVPPLTDFTWSLAIVVPLLWMGVNIYALAKTGKTAAKHWLAVRVVNDIGLPPGFYRVLMRESIRWGLPGLATYFLWKTTALAFNPPAFLGCAGLLAVAEGLSALLHPQRRALHDRLAGTYVIDGNQPLIAYVPPARTYVPPTTRVIPPIWVEATPSWVDEDRAIAAVVLTPDVHPWWKFWLYRWRSGWPILLPSLASAALLAGIAFNSYLYRESQQARQIQRQQEDQMFLALLSRLSSQSPVAPDERRNAILALGTISDQRALPLLIDLLGQEKNSTLIDALEQSLVSRGPKAITGLHRLNQTLRNELHSLPLDLEHPERRAVALRHRAVQRAIAKILTVYSGQLSNLDFSRIDLGATSAPAPFTLVLDQTDLSTIYWREANLSGSSLRGSRFSASESSQQGSIAGDRPSDLSLINLQEANLTDATLTHSKLWRANLSRAILNRANFQQADLTEANLSSARLLRSDFSRARLHQAILTGADLGEARFDQADLTAARLTQVSALGIQLPGSNLSESDWQGADLSGANLQQANLQQANLKGARLKGSNLQQAQLQNASLQDADLTAADLRGANLQGTDFQGTLFHHQTVALPKPGQFIRVAPVTGQVILLQGADFSRARNLSSEQLTYICARGGKHPSCPQ